LGGRHIRQVGEVSGEECGVFRVQRGKVYPRSVPDEFGIDKMSAVGEKCWIAIVAGSDWRWSAACRQDTIQQCSRTRRKNDHPVTIPSAAAAGLSVAQNLRRAARDRELL